MSFDNYSFWNELNISKKEYLTLKGLSSNKNIILQKAGKGNSVVLVNKVDYFKRKKELWSDVSLKILMLNMKRRLISYYSMKAN